MQPAFTSGFRPPLPQLSTNQQCMQCPCSTLLVRHWCPTLVRHWCSLTDANQDPAYTAAVEAAKAAAAPFRRKRAGCTVAKAAQAATKAWQ
eukprot:scaffold40448_cov15-Tisochrysis_lutea.AAC.1